MIAPLDELQARVLQLSAGDRARLAEVLIASLDEDAEIEAAWWVEADRRAAEVEAGTVQLIPGDQVFAEARARLKL
ncbi:MAG TPA: addiction module protein [Gemmatimonadaceae bacterium]|jgi:putative addiction module component (TIGR02574 family)|nr:addiction module protein [Gemmatimonadaceae bacterium]